MSRHLFIIGAQRSGTTYLYRVLDEHPEVFMAKPVKPEPKYFMEPANVALGYDTYVKNFFSDAGDAVWLGEKSTSYMEYAQTADAIKKMIPDATILVMLREPVERAISNYWFTWEHGIESYDIERAFREEQARANSWYFAGTSVSPYAYVERGKYVKYLEPWLRVFGRDRLILIVSEQFIGNQIEVSALYNRLGIDTHFIPPSLDKTINAGSADRTKNVLSSNLRDDLLAMYRTWNQKLAASFELDLSCWEKKT